MHRHLFAITALLLASTVAYSGPSKKNPPKPKDPTPEAAPAPPPPPEPEPPPEPMPPPSDKRRIVAVLDVHTGEGVDRELSTKFQKELNAKLDSKQYWVAPNWSVRNRMANSTKWVDGCLVGACLHEIKAQTGADVVLLASLTGSGTSFASVITIVRTDNGRAFSQEVERCDVCTVNEQLTASISTAVKLLKQLPDKLPEDSAVSRAAVDAVKEPLEERVKTLEAGQHHKGSGLVLTVAGLVAAAAGTALYFAENHANYGLATASAGAALTLGGVVVLTF